MTKEELLQKEIADLNDIIVNAKENLGKLNQELNSKEHELEEAGLPVITVWQSNAIRDAVACVFSNFGLDDPDYFECEFNISYDNRLELESIYMKNTDDLENEICSAISELFKITPDKPEKNED
jgi:hypothetical protein